MENLTSQTKNTGTQRCYTAPAYVCFYNGGFVVGVANNRVYGDEYLDIFQILCNELKSKGFSHKEASAISEKTIEYNENLWEITQSALRHYEKANKCPYCGH